MFMQYKNDPNNKNGQSSPELKKFTVGQNQIKMAIRNDKLPTLIDLRMHILYKNICLIFFKSSYLLS